MRTKPASCVVKPFFVVVEETFDSCALAYGDERLGLKSQAGVVSVADFECSLFASLRC